MSELIFLGILVVGGYFGWKYREEIKSFFKNSVPPT